jgi:5'-nucleotidase
MRILLSNDDGIHAPGILSLYEGFKNQYDTVAIAPHIERSTTGHSLSLDQPLRLHRHHAQEELYGCTGFPADCVIMGLGHHLKMKRPDVVISGINRGANLGQDLYYSGTMAAAREAAFHDVPAIAVSLVLERNCVDFHYETATNIVGHLLKHHIHQFIPKLGMININVPNLPLDKIKGIKQTVTGFRSYSEKIDARIDARQRSYFWIEGLLEGIVKSSRGISDSEAIEQGYVAVTPIQIIDSVDVNFTEVEKILQKVKDYPRGI